MSLRFTDERTDVLVASLARGELDFVIAYESAAPEGWEREPLGATPPHVVIAATHPLASAAEIEPRDLADEPLIVADLDPDGDRALAFLRRDGITPRIAYRTPNLNLAYSLVARGHGYTFLLQDPHIRSSREGLPLAAVPAGSGSRPEEVVACWPRSPGLTPRARAVVGLAREALATASPPVA